MPEIFTGNLRKMKVEATDPVSYWIPVSDRLFDLNNKLGRRLTISYTGNIHCIECGRKTSKSFSQGYCFPCFKSLAACDTCIVRPETCHFALGTCRDEKWAQSHCMQDHVVYLANSSGLKVGITRGTQIPARWIDQGASQAVAVFRVRNRLYSGLLEMTLRKQVGDRTDWRKLLKGNPRSENMAEVRDEIIASASSDLAALKQNHPDIKWRRLDETPVEFNYPVTAYPEKVTSLNLDKTAEISGTLMGIKGQYLIFDIGVINIRKHSGCEVSIG